MTTLAMIHMIDGDGISALPLFREALAGQRNCLGGQHPESLQLKAGDDIDTLSVLEEAAQRCIGVLGERHPQAYPALAILEKFRHEEKLRLNSTQVE